MGFEIDLDVNKSLYEQMRRNCCDRVVLRNTQKNREYIKELERALSFKDRYCKGEIICLDLEEGETPKQFLMKKLLIKMKEVNRIVQQLQELEEKEKK